jgi:hypothetical protein
MLGAREDPMCTAVDAAVEKEEFKLGQKRLKGLGMLVFGMLFAWDLLWNRVVEERTIFLPKRVVAELRRQAQTDLAGDPGTGEKPFISEGDVLTAWAIRAVASSLPQPRPVSALHAINARFRLPSLIHASGVYVQNMAVAAFTFLSAETANGPLGPIALENRSQLIEQATEGQMLAFLHDLRQESKSGSDPAVVCGEPDALLLPFTNWTRADFFKIIDFSPAAVRAGETGESRTNPPGTLVFHHAQSLRPSVMVRNVVVVLGKDRENNYWLTATLPLAAWSKVEEDITSRTCPTALM